MTHPGEDWYRGAEHELAQLATAVQQQAPIHLEAISLTATALIESLQASDQLVVHALSSPSGPPLITNLINVGVLATKLGIGLGYYGDDLHRLALAALVHDIGIFAISQNILTKTGRLTSDERALIEQHPRLGYESIRQLGESYGWLAEVVLQAHERGMGQGYPNKLKGRQISELAQIIGAVDIFDALISSRPYRRRLLPHQAVRELLVNERTAFPREVMKALVEQLSVYPLGTKVRLSSGEEGMVIRINPRYPSRPVVKIERANGILIPSRNVDLSAMPMVSVTDTIDPPAVDRVDLFKAEEPAFTTASSVNASDQFAVLLESLDAIASVIQTVVKKKEGSGELEMAPTRPAGPASDGTTTATPNAVGDLQKEVIGLFALEAREWLNQIQTAHAALEQASERLLQSKVLNIMLQGMTNLARSAAAVPLPAIENMATGLLPLLHSAARQDRATAAHHLGVLQEGLNRLATAVRELSPEHANEYGDPDAERQQVREAAESRERELGAATGPTSSGPTILDSLRRLHQVRGRSLQPMRDVLEDVIRRAEEQSEEGGDVIDGRTIGRILNDLNDLDERFLEHISERVPELVQMITRLREPGNDTPLLEALTPVLHHIDGLGQAVDEVGASTISIFLQGLRAFLLVAAHNQTTDTHRRLEAVEVRLRSLVPLAKQWVDIGRVERAAIIDILPV
jgi:HD domain-containing protein